MRCKALFGLRLLLGALLFAAGSGQTGGGLDVVVQQINTIGPRQWLKLMAGSMLPGTSATVRAARTASVGPQSNL